MHLVPFLNIFLSNKPLKTFLFVDSFGIFAVFLCIHYVSKRLLNISIGFSKLDFFVLLYIILSIFSFLLYLQPNNPASMLAYAYGIHHVVFPISLYFTVKYLNLDSQKFLLKYICYLNLFLIIVGFVMHYFKPDFFTEYLNNILVQKGYTETWQLYSRMQSYFGSTSIGNIAGVTILLISMLKMKFILKTLIFSSMIVAAFLSHQRGGIIVVIIAASYYLFSKDKHFLKKSVSIIVIIFFIFLLVNAFEYISTRSTGLSFTRYTKNLIVYDIFSENILKERLGGYIKGWNFFLEYPLGLGIGATLSAADVSFAHPEGQVVDANFMRILADLGFEGIIIFIFIITFSIKSALKRKNPLAWVLLISIYCGQMLGTNVLDSFYVSHTFWLLLGIIDTKPYYYKMSNESRKTIVRSSTADILSYN